MKKFVTLCSAVVLVGMWAVMSIGCGSGNPCETAYNKAKSCWQAKDCTTLTGAAQGTCDSYIKNSSYADFVAACEKAASSNPLGGVISCKCEGLTKTAAEASLACNLDTATCTCK